jgi:DNA repair protein RecO (recombination protein O)
MAQHHIHHTEGLVLGSRNRGEANKLIVVYTLDHGLVYAMAQGIRLHKSKLRYSLQDLSYVSVDLVHGRDIWRVTSATHISSFAYARTDIKSIALMARVCKLLERLCAGEEGNKEIFHDVIQAFTTLDTPNPDPQFRDALELQLVLRILHALGYIGDSDDIEHCLGDSSVPEDVVKVLASKKPIILAINKALRESQL